MSHYQKCQCNLCVRKSTESNHDKSSLHTNLFGSPFNCKKQIPTPKYPSANSLLSPKELDKLQHEIEEANNLLRSIGSVPNINNRRQLQLYIMSIRGTDVILSLICKKQEPEIEQGVKTKNVVKNMSGDKQERHLSLSKTDESKINGRIIELRGKIYTAGRDFIQINGVGYSIFVHYDRLLSIARDQCEYDKQPEQELIDVDQKMRRALAFNFGDFVSHNPELVNLFFGLTLYQQLNEYLGEEVKVRTFSEEIVGTLVKVDEGSIQILNKNNIEKNLNLNDICYIKILNLR